MLCQVLVEILVVCLQVTDCGVAALINLRGLKKLGLAHLHDLTCACIDTLMEFPSLEDLDLSHCTFSAVGEQLL
jgi:hypothetical protein